MPLEEGRLRLEHGDLGAERLDHGHREPLQPGGAVVETPAGQQARVRVDPDAELAAGVHGVAEPGTERFHRESAFLVVHAVVVRVGVDVGDRRGWVVRETDRLAELGEAASGELAAQLAEDPDRRATGR